MEILSILIMVEVKWVRAFAKTHQNVYLKQLRVIVWELYFNEVDV